MENNHIIVIDDDPMIRMVLCKLLEKEGYTVSGSEDGDVGLSIFDENPAALVVTDMNMPRMSGMEVIAALRQKSPDVKIIALSGWEEGEGGHDDEDAAVKAGADKSIAKPFNPPDVLAVIKAMFDEAA